MFTIKTTFARYVLIAVIACFSFMFGGPVAAQAPPEPETILRVDGIAGYDMTQSPQPTGLAWGTVAFKYLQDALVEAAQSTPPVAIWVRGGTLTEPVVYRPDQGDSVTVNERNETFRMAEGVRWYGGFAGDETALEFNDRLPFVRITVLSGAINTDPNDYSFHVVTAEFVDDSAVIDGFIVKDGNAVGETENDLSDPPTNCDAEWPLETGGGMLIRGASPCASRPQIVRVTFESNHADRGGAVAVNNTGSGTYGTVLWHCSFHHNTSDSDGGAAVVLTPETVPAAGPVEAFFSAQFYNCLFYRNESFDGRGGAIHIAEELRVGVDFCTIANNTATSFGAISLDETGCGTGVYRLKISGSIMWDNGSNPIGTVGTCINIKQSCIDGGWTCQATGTCPNNTASDPQFENSGADNYRLNCSPLSPCIAAAGDTVVKPDDFDLNQNGTSGNSPDLDLKTRVLEGADMGAFETQYDQCLIDINNDGFVGVPDLLAVINAWGACGAPCAADISPQEVCAGGDGTVGVPDLLLVINNWGRSCSDKVLSGPGGGMPFELSDCWNEACDGLTGEEWQDCVDKCVESYCQQYPEDCD